MKLSNGCGRTPVETGVKKSKWLCQPHVLAARALVVRYPTMSWGAMAARFMG